MLPRALCEYFRGDANARKAVQGVPERKILVTGSAVYRSPAICETGSKLKIKDYLRNKVCMEDFTCLLLVLSYPCPMETNDETNNVNNVNKHEEVKNPTW